MTLGELIAYITSDDCRERLMAQFDYVDDITVDVPGAGTWMFPMSRSFCAPWASHEKYLADTSRVYAHLNRLARERRSDEDGYAVTVNGGQLRHLVLAVRPDAEQQEN